MLHPFIVLYRVFTVLLISGIQWSYEKITPHKVGNNSNWCNSFIYDKTTIVYTAYRVISGAQLFVIGCVNVWVIVLKFLCNRADIIF